MSRKTFLIAVVAILAAGLLYYLYAGHEVPPGQQPLMALTPETLASLEDAFNQSKGDVRLLVLLSPT